MKRQGSIAGLSYDELIYLLDANKDHLVETEQVYVLGNHGIRQDMVLAATAIALPELPESEELIQLAEARLSAAGSGPSTPPAMCNMPSASCSTSRTLRIRTHASTRKPF